MVTTDSGREDVFAAIIGTGFGGLCMAIALKRAGIHDIVLFEKASALGGTWRDNHYPGCACDVPSHMYSFSFEPNPRWSETYAPHDEIRAYMERCADRHDVRRHIRFDTEVIEAAFDEAAGLWTVSTAGGERVRARIVVSAMGPLSRWSFPKIEGLSRFRGRMFHSAAWDHSFDLRGKRVASVGTGASAIQFIPAIAGDVAKLHVFQRTPAWVLPRVERPYRAWEKQLFEAIPLARELHRQQIYWKLEARAVGFMYAPSILRLAQRIALRHMHAAVKDPTLRRKLTPDYMMGCKRILMSNTYYPALARPHVEVVTDGIREITEAGIVAGDGVEREVDAIVFGTGFDVHDYLGKVRVTGRGGRDLAATWARGAEAYLGTTISGFPNLFTLVGPNTGLGHNSILYMIEAQVRYVMEYVRAMRAGGVAFYDVLPEAQRAYNDEIQRRLARTVWSSGCRSWYLDANGRNTAIWPGFTFTFRLATRRFDASKYAAAY